MTTPERHSANLLPIEVNAAKLHLDGALKSLNNAVDCLSKNRLPAAHAENTMLLIQYRDRIEEMVTNLTKLRNNVSKIILSEAK